MRPLNIDVIVKVKERKMHKNNDSQIDALLPVLFFMIDNVCVQCTQLTTVAQLTWSSAATEYLNITKKHFQHILSAKQHIILIISEDKIML